MLSVNACQLTDDGKAWHGLEEIGRSLAGNPHLEVLNARENAIDEFTVTLFVDALKADGLRALDLRDNPFADGSGGAKLSAAVRECRRLEGLNQCPRNPGGFRFFSTLEARISVNLRPIRLLFGSLIISARVLEIWTQTSLASTRTKSC